MALVGPSGNDTPPVGAKTDSNPKFYFTDGTYVAIACAAGVVLADTRVGPLVFGILTLALIYQTTLLVQGK